MTVALVADLGAAVADTVDAYIDFDPQLAEIVTENGTQATAVDINTGAFSTVSLNQVSHTEGRINVSASQLSGGAVSGTITIATMRVRLVGVPGTTVLLAFSQLSPRSSGVFHGRDPLALTLNGSSISVEAGPFITPTGTHTPTPTSTRTPTLTSTATVVPTTTPSPTPTVVASNCVPRPPMQIGMVRIGNRTMRVTVTAGFGGIQSIQFGSVGTALPNASVSIVGESGSITSGLIHTLQTPSDQMVFTLTQLNPSQAVTVPLVINDGCGSWNTFVGGGASAF